MGRRIQMNRNCLLGGMAVAALLMQSMEAAIARPGVQQMSSSSSGGSTSSGMSGHGPSVNPVSGNSGLSLVPEDFTKLRLAPGFLLSLNVLDDPDFVGTFRVDQQGDIALPILGTMHVAGKSVPTARAQIQKSLSDNQILNDPQVNLTVLEYTAPEVTIIGEVTSPGKYPMLSPRKLVDVLALAGGTTLTAANEVQITSASAERQLILVHYSRRTNPQSVDGVMVQPGDTVQVKRAGIVYVLGAVTRPGGFVMQEEGTLNVMQAIALAYGTTTLASTSTIYILHPNPDGSVTYTRVPYKQMTRGQSANIPLQAADVLFVPTSKMKTIYSNTQQLMNQAAIASIYLAAGI
jgi:polysaccharide biosynthesis/export protein